MAKGLRGGGSMPGTRLAGRESTRIIRRSLVQLQPRAQQRLGVSGRSSRYPISLTRESLQKVGSAAGHDRRKDCRAHAVGTRTRNFSPSGCSLGKVVSLLGRARTGAVGATLPRRAKLRARQGAHRLVPRPE